MVTVHVTETLQRFTAGQAELQAEGTTAGEVLSGLFARFPDLRARVLDENERLHRHLILFHNQTEVPRDRLGEHAVKDGDTLEIFGAMAGGGPACR